MKQVEAIIQPRPSVTFRALDKARSRRHVRSLRLKASVAKKGHSALYPRASHHSFFTKIKNSGPGYR